MSCLFCAIANGHNAATIVDRTGDALAFAPPPDSRLAPGHTIVIPLRHSDDLIDSDSSSLIATVVLAQKVARDMTAVLNAGGVNILHASGARAEQSIFHLHFHVVPRWDEDEDTLWPERRSLHEFDGDPYALLAASSNNRRNETSTKSAIL